MINLTREDLVEVMKAWNSELIANPDGFVSDPVQYVADEQADYFLKLLERVKERK